MIFPQSMRGRKCTVTGESVKRVCLSGRGENMLVKDVKELPADFPFEIQSYCQQQTKCYKRIYRTGNNFLR